MNAAPVYTDEAREAYHKIVKKLEDRIEKEDKKNANGTGNPSGA